MLKFYARRAAILALLSAVVWGFFGCPGPAQSEGAACLRAEVLDVEGLPNLHKVAPGVYRSAQPTAEGLRNAEAMGIKTVFNLRAMHSDDALAEGTGLILARVPINTWSLDEEELLAALRVILEAKGPVLVHCQHGADRTGAVVAAYRMVVQNWPREEAIAEMTDGGYGFHSVWGNLIVFLENLDVDRLRAQLKDAGAL